MAIRPFSTFGACPLSANDQATPSDAVPRKPRPRWLRFSLRTMLIMVTLLSIGPGWFVHRGERQRRAVAAVEEMGGKVAYDATALYWVVEEVGGLRGWLPRNYFFNVTMVNLSETRATDASLAHIKKLPHVRYLDLSGTDVTDRGLLQLQGLTKLESVKLEYMQVTDAGLPQLQGLRHLILLDFRGTQVTDAGLVHLGRLTRLRVLGLEATQVTSGGLSHLQGMSRLEELDLSGTQVTDAGLVHLRRLTLRGLRLEDTQVTDGGLSHLQGMSTLQELDLSGTQVTDAGLHHLKGLIRLKFLEFVDTPVTATGVAKLQIALPNCEISGPNSRRTPARHRAGGGVGRRSSPT